MQIKPFFLCRWAHIQVAMCPLSVTWVSLPWQPYTVFQKYYLHFNRTENIQRYQLQQLQQELIWNPSGRTIRVQFSLLCFFMNPVSVSSSLTEFQFLLLSRGAPMLSSKPLFLLNSSHGFPTISKTLPLGYTTYHPDVQNKAQHFP